MRSRVLWPTLLLACATRKPAEPGKPAPFLARSPSTAPASSPAASPEPTSPDEVCRRDGQDFAYPPEAFPQIQEIVCGYGPGTPCSGDEVSCDGDKFLYCQHRRLNMADCHEQCTAIGDDMMVTYDHGYCGDRGRGPSCICCDAGEPGCEHIIKPSPPRPVVPLAPSARTP